MKSLISCALIFVVSLAFGGATYRDCFEIVPGDIPHIAYSRNKAVDFSVDCIGESGWVVSEHCQRGISTVINVNKGDVVNDQLFTRSFSAVDGGPSQTFTFAFRWRCNVNETTTIYNYGWVTLGTNNGALTIVASEVADGQDIAIVGYPNGGEPDEVEARPDVSHWRAREQDGWMELVSGCIPRDTEGYVVIPKEIDGKPVRVIGSGAFAGYQRITGVRIPEGVREIGDQAFGDCSSLMTINLPKTLEILRDYAFVNCRSLMSVELPPCISKIGREVFSSEGPLVVHLPNQEADRIMRLFFFDPDRPNSYIEPPFVTFMVDPTEEEKRAGKIPLPFYYRDGKTYIGDVCRHPAIPLNSVGAIEIPAKIAGLSVYGVGERVFSECVGLTSVKIAAGVQSIGKGAFSSCRGLESIEIPASVTEFGSSPFLDCVNIASATLPGNLKDIYSILYGTEKLRFLTISEGCTTVEEGQFAGCKSLQSVAFPSTIRAIKSCAFQSCCQLKSITLPEGLLEVGESAFDGCYELKSVKFPTTLRKIGRYAFLGCYGLVSIDLQEGLLEVGEAAFAGCEKVRSLHIPGSLSVVGKDMFQSMPNLNALSFGEGVCIIGDEAFDGCQQLISVTFPSSLCSIGSYAFRGCYQLKALLLPDGLADVGEAAFECCDNVTVLHVPGSLSIIETGVFRDLKCLKVLTFGEGVRAIGDEAFRCCGELQSVVFPDSLVSIGDRAFESCHRLSLINLPEGLCDVGEDAFSSCDEVRLLTIPGSLSYVGDRAFRDMRGLKTLVIGEGVYGIGEESFLGCCEIEKIVFPSTLQFIGRDAFVDCGRLRPIDLPEGLLMVEEGAFRNGGDGRTIIIPSTLLYIGFGAFGISDDTVIRVAKGDVERVSGLFEDAGIYFEEGQIVEEGQMSKSELVTLADQLVAETFTKSFMQDFAALPPGTEVRVQIPNAQPGLLYAVGASATLDGLGNAVRDAQKVEATSEGVELTVVKPAGDSCFFRMAVEQP